MIYNKDENVDSSQKLPRRSCMSLAELHSRHVASLPFDDQIEYLLAVQEYIKSDDVEGWKRKFAPEKEVVKEVKKRRMGPNLSLFMKNPACISCHSEEVIDDVKQGNVVCTECGLIQCVLLSNDSSVLTHDELKTRQRDYVHRYSRVVYFRSFLMSLIGETNPVIDDTTLGLLRLFVGPPPEVTPERVAVALKKMRLSTKYRRHKEYLASLLSGGVYKPLVIEMDVFKRLLHLFRWVEFYYVPIKRVSDPGRRVFFSYPYVYYQLCFHLGLSHLTGPRHLLHCKKRQQMQHKTYGRVAKKCDLKCNLEAFR